MYDFSDKEIEQMTMQLLDERGPQKSICPSEVARALAGKDEKQWRLLMKPIRRIAINLAEKERLLILRKGRPVDLQNFKGIYRLAKKAPEPRDAN